MASTSKNTCNGGFSSLRSTPSTGGEGKKRSGGHIVLVGVYGGQASSSTTQTTTRSLFSTTFCLFFLGSLGQLNEAPMQQGFNAMVAWRTCDVATPVFLLLFATHKEFATVSELPVTRTDARLLVIRDIPTLCLRHMIGETHCPIECLSARIADLRHRKTSA